MEDQDLTEVLQVMNQQSLKITEQQEQISDLMSDLQTKDSQLSEALQIAEELKTQISDTALLLRENQRLRQLLRESDARTNALLDDVRKEFNLERMELISEKASLEKRLERKEAKKPVNDFSKAILISGIAIITMLCGCLYLLVRAG